MGRDYKLLLIHQFELPSISGVTVIISELLRLIPAVDPEIHVECESYQGFRTPDDLLAALYAKHTDTDCVVGINLHIEVGSEYTLELLRWRHDCRKPFYLHVHDYWSHHRGQMALLTEQYGARLLAITPHIARALRADGFPAVLLPVGVAVNEIPSALPAVSAHAVPATVASVGRLVPRKRFADIVRAFCHARLGPEAELYLRLPPSLVYSDAQDRALLDEIQTKSNACDADRAIHIDHSPQLGTNYERWAAYVSASEYEGVSMTPIESILQGCPALISDIPPHRAIIDVLFPGRAEDFIFPVGNHRRLARLLRDEVLNGWRRAEIASRQGEIHEHIERMWSLRRTARALAALTRGIDTEVGGNAH